MKNLKTQPKDEEMLKLYSLFKQVTVGDCNTGYFIFNKQNLFNYMYNFWCNRPGIIQYFSFFSLDRPGMLDFKGKAKWDAWNNMKGKQTNKKNYSFFQILFYWQEWTKKQRWRSTSIMWKVWLQVTARSNRVSVVTLVKFVAVIVSERCLVRCKARMLLFFMQPLFLD